MEEVARIVAQIRRRWPLVRILLRADSGFAREELMAWCEANGFWAQHCSGGQHCAYRAPGDLARWGPSIFVVWRSLLFLFRGSYRARATVT